MNSYVGTTTREGLSGLRGALAMYLGSTGVVSDKHAPRALTQMAQEVMSNSVDEFVDGYGSSIIATIHPDNSFSVQDFGRGMPKGPGDSFDDVIRSLTSPHTSGKFEGSGYSENGIAGMHGIGLKATNAASRWIRVEAISHATRMRSGQKKLTGSFEHYAIEFQQDRIIRQEIIDRFDELPEGVKTGTTITFLPDDGPLSETKPQPTLESIDWVVSDLIPRMEASAFLNKGLKISLIDERTGQNREWFFENGMVDYVKILAEGQTIIKSQKNTPIYFEDMSVQQGHKIAVRAAILFTEDVDSTISSYANGVPTREGGPHEDGFVSALVKSVNTFAQKIKGAKTFTDSDVLEGIVTVFDVRVPSDIATFEGQTKEKLGTALAKPAVQEIIERNLLDWFHDHESVAKDIVSRMQEAQEARTAAVKARQEAKKARQTKNKGSLITSSKLKRATSNDPKKKELYIVEGDSASNIGRDTKTQAVFPIRGKILNAYELSLTRALENVEISTIASVLGAGIGPAFEIDELDYNKVIIAADSDSDGSHIRTLLIGLFARFFPGLIDKGHLYYVVGPLYKATRYVKGKPVIKMYYTDGEIDADRKNLKGYEINRYKGLGEMDVSEAHEALSNPETRRLIQITQEDVNESKQILKILLGKNAAVRADWIMNNVSFENVEE